MFHIFFSAISFQDISSPDSPQLPSLISELYNWKRERDEISYYSSEKSQFNWGVYLVLFIGDLGLDTSSFCYSNFMSDSCKLSSIVSLLLCSLSSLETLMLSSLSGSSQFLHCQFYVTFVQNETINSVHLLLLWPRYVPLV